MPTARYLAILVIAALFTPPAASAQPGAQKMPQLPRLFGSFEPRAGVWSEYSVSEKEQDKKSTMRLAIVGQEGEAYWYEVFLQEEQSRNIIKMLVKGNPNNPENIQRLILKNGDNPAIEMPRDFVVMGRRMAGYMFESRSGTAPMTESELKVEKIGQREVTVPAGTFRVSQHRITDASGEVLGTFDFDPDILPIGVISSDTRKSNMVLVAHGSDATSLITEQPTMMRTPPGMPPGMPRGLPPGMPGTPPREIPPGP